MTAQNDPGGAVLAVTVGDRRLGILAEAVREVGRVPALAPIPLASHALLGLANVRGAVVPVVSVARLLGQDGSDSTCLVVVMAEDTVGLAVDTIGKVEASAADPALDLSALLAPLRAVNTGRRRHRADNARHTERVRPAEPTLALVLFAVAGQDFALPLASVEEVLAIPPNIAALPQGAAAAIGSMAWQGRTLALLSLAALLGLPDSRSLGTRVIVLRLGAQRVGLVVERLGTIIRVAESAIDPVPAALSQGTGEARVQAIARLEGDSLLVSILAADQILGEDLTARLLKTPGSEASPAAAVGASAQAEPFLLFRLGKSEYAMPLEALGQVLPLPASLAPLPNAPSFVRGIMNWRGLAVPVIDQARRFGADAQPRPRDRKSGGRVLILDVGGIRAALLVDEIVGIRRFSATDLAALPDIARRDSGLFDEVAAPGNSNMTLVLSPAELLADAEIELLRGLELAS